jgi:predicted nucleic acid-binding protein
MKTALIDASSAILLYKAGVMGLLTEHYHTVMVPEVFKEVAVPDYPGARYFETLRKTGVIDVTSRVTSAAVSPDLSCLDAGERETLLHFPEYPGAFIIMDDKKGSGYCRNESIPYINALLVPKILYFSKKIDNTLCGHFTETLIHMGRYSQSVLVKADAFASHDLTYFICDTDYDDSAHRHPQLCVEE